MKRIIEAAKQLGSHAAKKSLEKIEAAKKHSCPTIKGFSGRVCLYTPK